MNNLAVLENKSVNIWEGEENLKQIRKLFAPALTELEFIVFVEMGKLTGLNPFLKEIWAVKYDKTKSAQIFIGRDGYRKGAQRHPLYDFHSADAVYSNDEFVVDDGVVSHRYSIKDRGVLKGAYCLVKRKGSTRATYVFVELDEYNKKQSTWKDLPATMIKKVAETQALRMAFQELFGGTYSEYEQFRQPNNEVPIINKKGVSLLKEKLGMESKEEIIEAEYDPNTGEVIESEIEHNTELEKKESEQVLEAIQILMEGATNTKELMNAMKMAKDLPTEEKKKVSEWFNLRQQELNG